MWHIRKNRKKRIRMLVHPLQERVLLIRKEIKKKVTLLFVNSSWVEGVNQIEKAKKNQKSVIKSQRAFLESTDLKKKNQIRSTYFLTSIINLKVFLMHVQLIYAYFFQLFLFLLARYLSDKLIPNWMSKNLQCTFVIDLLLLPSGSSYHYVLINDLISWSIEIEKNEMCLSSFHVCSYFDTLQWNQVICYQKDSMEITTPSPENGQINFKNLCARSWIESKNRKNNLQITELINRCKNFKHSFRGIFPTILAFRTILKCVNSSMIV